MSAGLRSEVLAGYAATLRGSRPHVNVLGISGLHYSASFKSGRVPGLSEYQRRIVQGLDSAAALVTADGMRAAAQERFSRVKGTGSFPADAIKYCLAQERLTLGDIDYIAHGFSYEPYREKWLERDDFARSQFSEVYSRDALLRAIHENIPEAEWDEKIVPVEHHIAHAASAFYLSGFDESLILVADGMGEIHSTTIAVGELGKIEVIGTQVLAPNSLGILYGVFSLYLGFCMNLDEYKVMGLASHGNPAKYFDAVMDLVSLNSDGTYTIPVLSKNHGLAEKETYEGTIREIESVLGPRRNPGAEITPHHQNVAAAVQAVLQNVLMHILRDAKEETGQQRLCMAGGVALNCTANGVIRRSRLFREICVQSAAGDDGTALGAALYAHMDKSGKYAKFTRMAPHIGGQNTAPTLWPTL